MDMTKYENDMPYPVRPVHPLLKKGSTPDEVRAFADALEKYEKDLAEFNAAIKAYRAHDNELYSQFREDVLKEVGLTGHPKADSAFNFARDKAGDSDCREEILEILEELAALMG
jgi:hypothetical protein